MLLRSRANSVSEPGGKFRLIWESVHRCKRSLQSVARSQSPLDTSIYTPSPSARRAIPTGSTARQAYTQYRTFERRRRPSLPRATPPKHPPHPFLRLSHRFLANRRHSLPLLRLLYDVHSLQRPCDFQRASILCLLAFLDVAHCFRGPRETQLSHFRPPSPSSGLQLGELDRKESRPIWPLWQYLDCERSKVFVFGAQTHVVSLTTALTLAKIEIGLVQPDVSTLALTLRASTLRLPLAHPTTDIHSKRRAVMMA